MSSLLVSPAFHEDHTLFAAGIEDGILRSRDGGQTWEHANEGLPGPQILSLALSPRFGQDGTLLAALSEGLFRTEDGGQSWTTAGPEGLADPRMVSYSQDTSGSQLYAGLASGPQAYLSENGGGIWRELSGPFADEEVVAIALSPAFHADHTLLLATFSATGALRRSRERAPGARQPFREDAPQSAVTVWRSTDSGRRWAPVIEQITSARWVTFGFPSDYRGDQESSRNGFFAGIGTLIQRPMWGGKQLWMAERVGRPNTAILALSALAGPHLGPGRLRRHLGRRLPLGRRGPHLARPPRGSAQPHRGGRLPDPHLPRRRGRLRPHPGGRLASPRPRVNRGGEPSG